MAWSLLALSHYLKQCWLIISEVFRYSPEGNFTTNALNIYPWFQFENYQTEITWRLCKELSEVSDKWLQISWFRTSSKCTAAYPLCIETVTIPQSIFRPANQTSGDTQQLEAMSYTSPTVQQTPDFLLFYIHIIITWYTYYCHTQVWYQFTKLLGNRISSGLPVPCRK